MKFKVGDPVQEPHFPHLYGKIVEAENGKFAVVEMDDARKIILKDTRGWRVAKGEAKKPKQKNESTGERSVAKKKNRAR
jgi:hypothetical protein